MESKNQTNQVPTGQRGGKRKGAGRPKDSLTVKTREVAERLSVKGRTPLEVMMRTVNLLVDMADKPLGEKATAEEAAQHERTRLQHMMSAAGVAKDCAPYCHPRLSSVEVAGPNGNPIPVAAIVANATPDQAGQMYLDMVKGAE